MKVALFSDVITWIGTGYIYLFVAPDAIDDGHGQLYSNLVLQGGSSVVDDEIKAAYVQCGGPNQGACAGAPSATLTNVRMFDKPISTEGA